MGGQGGRWLEEGFVILTSLSLGVQELGVYGTGRQAFSFFFFWLWCLCGRRFGMALYPNLLFLIGASSFFLQIMIATLRRERKEVRREGRGIVY